MVERAASTGLSLALEMSEVGILMRAERYRREHPDATNNDVEEFIRAWLLERPGAPDGDAIGRPVALPRHS